MHERSLFSLLDIPGSARLHPLAQDAIETLLHGADLLTDPRIRRIAMERVNPSGKWEIVSTHSFLDLDDKGSPFRPVAHPPRHISNTALTDGSKQHRRREQG